MTFESRNPFTEELITSFESLKTSQIEQKLTLAKQAYASWKNIPFDKKSTLFFRVSEILEKNKEQYAQLITVEMGKVIREARAEIEKCAMLCRYYAENAEKHLVDEIVATEGTKSYIRFEPLGAVFAVMPWNFPFWQAFRFAIPSLMAGNVAFLKHAPNVPQCALAIENIFLQAGFEEGVFQNLFLEITDVESIIASDIVQAVTLTGSERAGSQVASLAGKYLKKTVLELGGSDAFVVLADADLDITIPNARLSRMINMGQSCIAAKRFIVEEDIYESFLQKFIDSFKKLQFGNPLEESSDYACLARPDLAKNIENQVQRSIEQGANMILGNSKANKAFFEPTILTNITPHMLVFNEELFGPVASVIVVQDENEAIQLANRSVYGLGASVWTKDLEKGEKVAQQLEAGSCFVNAIVKSTPLLPFGGIKRSGYGRELSIAGIREFVNMKAIFVK
ncbi:succinate-semialdehyde dehydrogenase [bacterium 336/3]|nr:succinate-semialdehyde dehydrogenase [bacterium 336/3]